MTCLWGGGNTNCTPQSLRSWKWSWFDIQLWLHSICRHQMPLRLQLFCGHFSTQGCQAMRICRTPHRINCSKRLAGGHEDYTGRIIPRVAWTITHVSFWLFFSAIRDGDDDCRWKREIWGSIWSVFSPDGSQERLVFLVGVLCLSTCGTIVDFQRLARHQWCFHTSYLSFFLHGHNFFLNFSPRKSAWIARYIFRDKTA